MNFPFFTDNGWPDKLGMTRLGRIGQLGRGAHVEENIFNEIEENSFTLC